MTGEKPCCETLNDPFELLINTVVSGGGVTVGGLGDVDGTYHFNPKALVGITTSLNTLGDFLLRASGGMAGLGGLASPSNILATGAGSVPVGGVWRCSDLSGNAGRLTILMNVN